jgi:two-component system LytT family response regulator
MKSIKAVLIDDVEVMRITLKKVLEQFPHINIIGEASSFDEAKEVVNRLKPDLLFLDIDLNGLISIDLLEELN